jgi:hypothetical protein
MVYASQARGGGKNPCPLPRVMICIKRHWPDGQGGAPSSYGEHNGVMPYRLSFMFATSTIPRTSMPYIPSVSRELPATGTFADPPIATL